MSEIPEEIRKYYESYNAVQTREAQGMHYARRVNDLCGWGASSEVDNDAWETSCGKTFVIIAGTPSENDFLYCPYCGRKIHEIVIPETEW